MKVSTFLHNLLGREDLSMASRTALPIQGHDGAGIRVGEGRLSFKVVLVAFPAVDLRVRARECFRQRGVQRFAAHFAGETFPVEN